MDKQQDDTFPLPPPMSLPFPFDLPGDTEDLDELDYTTRYAIEPDPDTTQFFVEVCCPLAAIKTKLLWSVRECLSMYSLPVI